MEIRDNNNVCIFAPLNPKLDYIETERLIKAVKSEQSRKVAIDLSYVEDCTMDFIDGIQNLASNVNLCVFNIPSDIFALFNIFELDKKVALYVCELDFENNTRQLLNRKFSIL